MHPLRRRLYTDTHNACSGPQCSGGAGLADRYLPPTPLSAPERVARKSASSGCSQTLLGQKFQLDARLLVP